MPKQPIKKTVSESLESLASLQAKIEAIEASKVVISSEREAVAHAALADGDPEARATLERLTAEAVQLNADLENLSAAIATAQRRVTEAQERQLQAEAIDRAKAAKIVIAERQEIAARISASLASFASDFGELIESGLRLEGLTKKHIHPAAASYAATQALYSACFDLSRHGHLRLPAPALEMRKPLCELVSIADSTSAAWVSRVLCEAKAEKAA